MSSVAESVAAAVADAGVERVFGLLGEGNLAIAVAVTQQGRVTWTALRREDAVVCAADGYAQGSGRCGVAMVTHGPALTNTITALVGARKGGTPLVLITGEIDPAQSHAPQYLDQRPLVEAIGVPYHSLDRAAAATGLLSAAITQAERDRTPVVVGIRTNLQHEPCEAGPAEGPTASPTPPPPPIAARTEQIQAAADALSRARRPLLLAGRGALGARDSLVRLAERTGGLLATTLLTKGMFGAHSRAAGVCGGFAPDGARAAIARADLVLAFGAGLNDYTTISGSLLRHATVVHIDRDPAAFGRHYDPDLTVHGDAAEVADRLTELVGDVGGERWDRPPPVPEPGFTDESSGRGLDLRTVSVLLERHLPARRGFVSDLGYYTSEPTKFVSVPAPEYQAFCLHFGSIGLGLATAIGLSTAHPDVPTLCAIGDGGLVASLGELETLARLGLPVTVAVYDDSAYGVEWQALRHEGNPVELSEFPPVDFAAVARGLHIPAVRAESERDFPAVAALLADAAAGPCLIDFTLDRAVLTSWYRELVLGEA